MDATDLARVKVWLQEQQTTAAFSSGALDGILTPLITACSAALEGPEVLNRGIETAARTEVYELRKTRTRVLSLRNAPVATSPAAVLKIASDGDFASAEALVSGIDYVLLEGVGQVRFLEPVVGPTYLQVVSTAGMAADLDALETAYPDLVHAVTIWVGMLFSRRKNLDATVRSGAASSGAKTWQAPMGGPPDVVMAMLRKHRRVYA